MYNLDFQVNSCYLLRVLINVLCCFRHRVQWSHGEDVRGQLLQRRGQGVQVRPGDVGPRGPARPPDQPAQGVDRKTRANCDHIICFSLCIKFYNFNSKQVFLLVYKMINTNKLKIK